MQAGTSIHRPALKEARKAFMFWRRAGRPQAYCVEDAIAAYLASLPFSPPMTEEERRELVYGMYEAYKDDCHFPTSTTGIEAALALIESRYTLVRKP